MLAKSDTSACEGNVSSLLVSACIVAMLQDIAFKRLNILHVMCYKAVLESHYYEESIVVVTSMIPCRQKTVLNVQQRQSILQLMIGRKQFATNTLSFLRGNPQMLL